jgi:hypothetical protein
MKSFKKYRMAGPDWYEKFEEVPHGRTRLVRIFFESTQYQDHWAFSQKFHIRPTWI